MENDYYWDYANIYEWMGKVGKMDPLIITVCINGGVQGKEVNPALPEKPDEIAQSTYEAYNAGASEVHIHARNPERLYDLRLIQKFTEKSTGRSEINVRTLSSTTRQATDLGSQWKSVFSAWRQIPKSHP
ncbi:MAG TPA: 3-keto-5-aminohexanoate cleavage protein [Anaerovoracaceae bacterium]|nr:3-keto-5-aminohexanoate cleavage protein [Anaerovoracaceae bacterium]